MASNDKLLASAQILERWENTPTPWDDLYSDMSDIEKSKQMQLLIGQRDEARRREEATSQERAALQNRIMELIDQNSRLMKQSSRQMEELMDQICELTRLLHEKENENSRLQSRLDVANRSKYDRISQKNNRSGNNRNEGDSPADYQKLMPATIGIPANKYY